MCCTQSAAFSTPPSTNALCVPIVAASGGSPSVSPSRLRLALDFYTMSLGPWRMLQLL